ncbi:hypothetical protein ACIQAC_35170 [Streptomyces sp. NPDC088387]|uniref:hypothetical protein n=1 Tax=Streptomyces sp. NPDC088387 TaxID=3365859 RepID=UPI00382BB0FE
MSAYGPAWGSGPADVLPAQPPFTPPRAERHLAGTPSTARVVNDRATLTTLFTRARTIAEIRALTGVSKPTAYQSVARLHALALAEPVPDSARPGAHSPGPPPQQFRIPPGTAPFAAVSLAGGRLQVRLADAAGRLLGESDGATAPAASPVTADDVCAALAAACASSGLLPAQLDVVVVAAPLHLAEALGASAHGALADRAGTDVQVVIDADSAATAAHDLDPAARTDTYLFVWADAEILLSGRLQGRPVSGCSGSSLARRTARFFDGVDTAALDELRRTAACPARNAGSLPGGTPGAPPPGGARTLAAQLALALAGPAALLDPRTVLLAGPRFGSLAPVLAPLVQEELEQLIPAPPTVCAAGVPGDAVMAGALRQALTHVRGRLVGSIDEGAAQRMPRYA